MPAFTFGKKICSWCVQYEAAQRGEQSEETLQRVETPPWLRRQDSSGVVTKAIFGMNVAVFLGMLFAGVSIIDNPSGQDLVHWGANFGPLTLNGQWWRLLTYMFEHGSLIHIALNMWCLWNLGLMAESLYGSWTFGVIYILCGITGGLGSLWWHPTVPSVGASGAIFGIAGALISAFSLGEFSLPRDAIRGTLRSVVTFVGYNLVFGAALSGIDNAAHIGGLVGGLAVGALIAKAAPDGEDLGRRFGVLALALVLIVGGTGWYFYSHDYVRHMQRGAGFLAEGKTDQAIDEFQSVIRRQPKLAAAHYQLAQAYIGKRDYEKAQAELEVLLSINPGDPRVPYLIGSLWLERGNPPQARKTFEQMLARDPKKADAYFGLGEAALAEGKNDEAIAEFQRSLQLEPELEGAYYNIGLAQLKLKRYDDAIASFKKEIDANGEDYDVEVALADAYDAKGLKKEADDARRVAKDMSGKK
jgi:membrane associated rhomboid family serine protease/Tfp pilus assembly protein PilF